MADSSGWGAFSVTSNLASHSGFLQSAGFQQKLFKGKLEFLKEHLGLGGTPFESLKTGDGKK